IHVAGVKDRPPFCAKQNAGRAEHMTGAAKFETQLVVRPDRAALTVHGERLAQGTMLPPIRRPLCFAMSEKRINHAYLLAFPRHYVDRVVKKRVADRGR